MRRPRKRRSSWEAQTLAALQSALAAGALDAADHLLAALETTAGTEDRKQCPPGCRELADAYLGVADRSRGARRLS